MRKLHTLAGNSNTLVNQLTEGANLMIVKRILMAMMFTAILMTAAVAQSSEKRVGWAAKTDATAASGAQEDGRFAAESLTASAPNPKPTDLTGSWLLTITPNGGFPPPFKALVTFNADGGLVGASQGDVCECGVATAGHGAWTKTADRRYSFTFLQISYDFQGNFTGTSKVRLNVTLNQSADVFTGPYQLDVFGSDGSLLFSATGITQGRRIVVEPLN